MKLAALALMVLLGCDEPTTSQYRPPIINDPPPPSGWGFECVQAAISGGGYAGYCTRFEWVKR